MLVILYCNLMRVNVHKISKYIINCTYQIRECLAAVACRFQCPVESENKRSPIFALPYLARFHPVSH